MDATKATTFRQLIAAVTAELGEGFRLQVPEDAYDLRYRIVHDDGREIMVTAGGAAYDAKPGQMRITSIYPRDRNNGNPYTGSYVDPREVDGAHITINISESKSAQQIARDITRRFLAEYSATFGRICELISARNAARADVAAVTEQLRQAMHASRSDVRIRDDKQSATISRYLETDSNGALQVRRGARVQATVHSADSVALEVTNLSPETATKLLALLRLGAE